MIRKPGKADMRLLSLLAEDSLYLITMNDDGLTYSSPVQLWFVVVNNAIYVRAYNGLQSHWYQAALKHKKGRIIINRESCDVSFQQAIGPINDLIDETYQNKYADEFYLDKMIYEPARTTTLRILPLTLEPMPA